MNQCFITRSLVALLILLTTNVCTAFEMYISTGYTDPPDFSKYGFISSKIIYEQQIYNHGEDRNNITPFHINKIISELEKSESKNIILDIEHWNINWQKVGYFHKREITKKYVDTVKELKSALPGYLFGYYGIVPAWPHWDINKSERHFNKWNEDNKLRQLVGDVVDVFYPSLYTYNENPNDWKDRATMLVSKARIMAKGKKVIVFLWPRYHQSSKPYRRGVRTLPTEYWRFQLEHIKTIADGVIIWDGALGSEGSWGPSQPWWNETKAFIIEHFPEKIENLKSSD